MDPGQAGQDALATLLLRMQRVQARIRLVSPSTTVRTVCKFGYQRRFVRLLAWLTLLPVVGPLPHTVQTRAILDSPGNAVTRNAGKP